MTNALTNGISSVGWPIVAAISFFGLLFTTFFFWNRIVVKSDESDSTWSVGLVGSILACALFIACFVLGVWFSIARMKGDGWILSA